MSPKQARQLGDYLRQQRQQRGISTRGLAREVGVDMAQIVRLEKGDVSAPKVDTLAKIARALSLPLADVYGLAGYETTAELPSFTPYLRTKYRDLPDEAVAEMESFLDRLRAKHGLTGPTDREDEN